ncbi:MULTISPECIES: PadR family transcriptional regulator [Roseivirga]|jgi:DNA-binding PadR family transcriptional regulator|uniref:PadR family transcriptional regulator n=1 Tax=Roseivirga spongicola TaxID=333140 RepID=A0A150X449_9BACT|nr:MULTISPECIES: helix-turn-helix transcriptional regulator [Roseivirga]KYG73372.1 PadR family transcriptional regulator [Roseivirga spongicola]MBO6496492.1 helix-turn-helix transcriptional regulator [Roseivirga sp.]MBO6659616.1 helix-turn-helix transcriptional regulator [Roseivirga sp.]MBO6762560.1 helix-turn-helix transcriptional regulator [Roseivirga sp.]MBO6907647.1 helix-turn-helix transcriptional regulator [Roseivirga sp.]
MGKSSLGEFEEVVLLTVAVLYENAYGISIKEDIEKRLARKVSVGAMRTALSRLEKKGFLRSEFGDATPERGGKRKRFYKVTPHGKKALEQVMETRKKLWEAIPSVAFDF